MTGRAWRAAVLLFLAAGEILAVAAAAEVCPRSSSVDSILGGPETCSALDSGAGSGDPIGVVEGDEATFHRVLNLVYSNSEDYVAVLFYASWCPFSRICYSNFHKLSTLFPTIRHFAFEESVIRPSILSRYGVHGFPTLFLFNSTIRVRYHGPRTVTSLVAFFKDVTGVNPISLDSISMEKVMDLSNVAAAKEDAEQEDCPFPWARSPEKLLQQDTYLALASSFLLLRLLYILLPKLNASAKSAWRRHTRFASLMNLREACIDQTKQGFKMFLPSKSGNLQGAMNASAWASKSLASVSIGESSSGRVHLASERR